MLYYNRIYFNKINFFLNKKKIHHNHFMKPMTHLYIFFYIIFWQAHLYLRS